MFVLRMAVRETRASMRRLFFFFVCIAVGVAAIVTLRSVIQSVRGVFGTEAKSLIAADIGMLCGQDLRINHDPRSSSMLDLGTESGDGQIVLRRSLTVQTAVGE